MAVRLDYPNLQVQSEELVDYLHTKNEKKYGLKLKEPEKFKEKPIEAPIKLLGKRDHLEIERSAAVVDLPMKFDTDQIKQEIEVTVKEVEQ